MSKKNLQRLDRRKFLAGAAGGILALPMLESFAPRLAFGQTAAPPKRLLLVMSAQGREVGCGLPARNGNGINEWWSPLAATGAYPATGTLSPLLAGLEAYRNQFVTIDGIDNLVRHASSDPDGHQAAKNTTATCTASKPGGVASSESIDYVAGLRLRASASQRMALVFPAGPYEAEWMYSGRSFYGPMGTQPALLNSNPAQALKDVFGSMSTTPPEPMAKTLRDRLTGRRASILDSVAKDYEALRSKVSASDKDRLDRHATFIRTLETRLAGGGPTSVATGCAMPNASAIPNYAAASTLRGEIDGQVTPFQIENVVMSLACDITRTATLHFDKDDNPTFASEFDGASPLGGSANWHGMIHGSDQLVNPDVANLVKARGFYNKMFSLLLKRLSEVQDTDGSPLLDNTLVVWFSDFGYGSLHFHWNTPILMAGMKSAFSKGQGRHIVSPRRSHGDLWAQVLRMLGGSDTTFGATGTIGDILTAQGLSAEPFFPTTGYRGTTGEGPNFVTKNLNVHQGSIDI